MCSCFLEACAEAHALMVPTQSLQFFFFQAEASSVKVYRTRSAGGTSYHHRQWRYFLP